MRKIGICIFQNLDVSAPVGLAGTLTADVAAAAAALNYSSFDRTLAEGSPVSRSYGETVT